MSTPLPDDLPTVLNDIRNGVRLVQDVVDDIVGGINDVLDQLPPVVVGGIRDAVDDMHRLLAQHLATVEALLARAGSPAALRAAGSMWTTDIGGPASGLAGPTSWNGMQADDHWTGLGANAYRNTLPVQQASLLAIKTTSDEVDALLQDAATSINDFWVSIGGAVIGLGVALLTAVLEAASVIGAPVAVPVAIGALSLFGSFVNDAISAHNAITNDNASRSAALDRRLYNDYPFDTGSWPRSTTEISSDGAITDGDDTDWHLR